MLEWVFGNAHYKLAALFLAIMAWLYVQSDQVHEAPVKATLQWELAAGLVPVDPLPTQVAVRVRGPRGAIRRARTLDLQIDVDLRDVGPGDQNIELGPFPVERLPSQLEVLSIAPSGVRFTLDEVSQRKVKIQPVVVGEPAAGYALERIQVVPPVVTLSGPGVVIAEMAAVDTAPIDLSGLAGSSDVPCELDLPRSITSEDAGPFTARVEVLAQDEERRFLDVPVFVWNNPRYTALVPTVEVVLQGPAAMLDAVGPEDLAAFVHLDAAESGAREEVAWGPKDGSRLRVLHTAGEGLEVRAVAPSRIEVVAR
jgi:YbbR domain-containing protein